MVDAKKNYNTKKQKLEEQREKINKAVPEVLAATKVQAMIRGNTARKAKVAAENAKAVAEAAKKAKKPGNYTRMIERLLPRPGRKQETISRK